MVSCSKAEKKKKTKEGCPIHWLYFQEGRSEQDKTAACTSISKLGANQSIIPKSNPNE